MRKYWPWKRFYVCFNVVVTFYVYSSAGVTFLCLNLVMNFNYKRKGEELRKVFMIFFVNFSMIEGGNLLVRQLIWKVSTVHFPSTPRSHYKQIRISIVSHSLVLLLTEICSLVSFVLEILQVIARTLIYE